MGFVDDLSQAHRLRAAWSQVFANRGMPGIDRVSVFDFDRECDSLLSTLAEEMRSGNYRPLPVLRIRPAFLAESDRALVIPTVRDRVVQ